MSSEKKNTWNKRGPFFESAATDLSSISIEQSDWGKWLNATITTIYHYYLILYKVMSMSTFFFPSELFSFLLMFSRYWGVVTNLRITCKPGARIM